MAIFRINGGIMLVGSAAMLGIFIVGVLNGNSIIQLVSTNDPYLDSDEDEENVTEGRGGENTGSLVNFDLAFVDSLSEWVRWAAWSNWISES